MNCNTTHYRANSSSVPGDPTDGNRKLVFTSDRSGQHGLAVLDLQDGSQRPLTAGTPGEAVDPFQTAVDGVRNRAYAWIGDGLEEIDCHSGARRLLHRLEPGWHGIIPNVTCDGASIAFGEVEVGGNAGYERLFEAHPRSRILVHDLASGRTRCIHERQAWLGHVNTSPADPHLISFCHEGPWTRVEHRVWCCDLRDGRTWKVRPDLRAPACIGHEYWLADGRRIAYHGFDAMPRPVLGIVDVHTGDLVEHAQPFKTKHSHSLDGRWIVGDGSEQEPWILLWHLEPDRLRGPWRICRHGGGWSEQRRHVHPRMAPDGRSVLFTSDAGGTPRIFSVELPEQPQDAWAIA